MTSLFTPKRIQMRKTARRLVIEWSDGMTAAYPWELLRAHCPSAGEVVARGQANPLAVLKKLPSSDMTEVRAVGSYAISFTWADGHNVGIYTWDHLRQLASHDAVEKTAASPQG